MSACRVLQACTALNSEFELLQSDCQRAYVQADLDGPDTFIEQPREWWPKHWAGKRRPVCRLRKALYGHPRAGDLWADKLGTVLKAQGFETVDSWPSLYYKYTSQGRAIIDVYVDDLVMFGSKSKGGIRDEISVVRKAINMDDPAPLGRYLGVNHRTSVLGKPGKQTTEASTLDAPPGGGQIVVSHQ